MEQFIEEKSPYLGDCCSWAFIAWYSPNLNPTLCVNFIYFSAHWPTQFDSLSSKFFERNPCVKEMVDKNLALRLRRLCADYNMVILTPRTPVLTHFWKHDSTRKLYSLITPTEQVTVSKSANYNFTVKTHHSPTALRTHSTSETPSSDDLPKIYWTLLSGIQEHFPFCRVTLQPEN